MYAAFSTGWVLTWEVPKEPIGFHASVLIPFSVETYTILGTEGIITVLSDFFFWRGGGQYLKPYRLCKLRQQKCSLWRFALASGRHAARTI